MDIDFSFICDYAEAGAKINAIGIGFDTLLTPEVPSPPRNFFVVAQVRASIAEAGDKALSIRLIDADGVDVMPAIEGSINVPVPPSGATETLSRIVIGFNSVQFPRYSMYAVHIVIQGTEMVRIPLRVAQPPTTA